MKRKPLRGWSGAKTKPRRGVWTVVKDTSGGGVYVAYNDAGTMPICKVMPSPSISPPRRRNSVVWLGRSGAIQWRD
jgi:hypothetical protein